VATLIDDEGLSARIGADQLGHSKGRHRVGLEGESKQA
jgi:hypothetical protein